jgi:hypothetical protein
MVRLPNGLVVASSLALLAKTNKQDLQDATG